MSDRKEKKIAFYIGSLTIGGAERVICNLAEYFYSIGYQVYVVTKLREDKEYELHEGIERIIADITATEQTGSRIGNLRARIRKLRGIWKDIRPDIIVSFIGKNNLMALASAKPLGIPVVVSVRSAPSREMASKAMKFSCMLLFRKAAGIVLQTTEAIEFFPRSLQKKVTILQNSISPVLLNYVDSAKKSSMDIIKRNDIIAVGRIDDNKNEKMLVDAFAAIAEKYSDWNVKLYGDGERMEELSSYTEQLGLKDRISFCGSVGDVPKRMMEASIFVLPSRIEGMPNSLIEAMTLGLPCISTDCPCGGPRDLIESGVNGILVPVDDVTALSDSLERLINDSELRDSLGNNAKRIIDRLHPDIVNTRWQEYIESKLK